MVSSSSGIGGVCAGLAGASLALAAHAAWAEPPSLGQVLFGRPRAAASTPVAARYEAEPGQSFIFERQPSGPALLKFDDAHEIWALNATPGPRGDVIYKNDVGEPMLRATRLGGLTLFTPDRPGGVAASLAGQAPMLKFVSSLSPSTLFQILREASARASRAAQHLIAFEALEVTPGAEPVYADAAILTAEAFTRVASRGGRAKVSVQRFVRVRFSSGKSPTAQASGSELRIIVAPDEGVVGRPSSERVAAVIARR